MVVNGAFGLGETTVGGGACDTFQLSRLDGSLQSCQISEKRRRAVPMEGGGLAAQAIGDGQARSACLDPADLHLLFGLVMRTERLFGRATDVVWIRCG